MQCTPHLVLLPRGASSTRKQNASLQALQLLIACCLPTSLHIGQVMLALPHAIWNTGLRAAVVMIPAYSIISMW